LKEFNTLRRNIDGGKTDNWGHLAVEGYRIWEMKSPEAVTVHGKHSECKHLKQTNLLLCMLSTSQMLRSLDSVGTLPFPHDEF